MMWEWVPPNKWLLVSWYPLSQPLGPGPGQERVPRKCWMADQLNHKKPVTTLQLEMVLFFFSFIEVKLTKLWGISRGHCNDLMYVYIVKGFPLLVINASITSCSSLCVSVVRTFCQCGQLSHHGLYWIVRFYSYLKVCTVTTVCISPILQT